MIEDGALRDRFVLNVEAPSGGKVGHFCLKYLLFGACKYIKEGGIMKPTAVTTFLTVLLNKS